ncbi:hypothetical protein THRCLA_22012 [Thraustotheca clavata]|uniref:Uncharacterized protein n=1 Tax=Thraustotheca clavata TaxID=74557 RepID=A0A1V9ZE46_9STRA|nr:hypothetical protein THRCLA_22012 [Thraustotheca clavata]
MWQVPVIIAMLVLVIGGSVVFIFTRPQAPTDRFEYFLYSNFKALLYFRVFCVLYYLVMLINQFIESGIAMYEFYTLWNFTLQFVYFVWVTTYQYSHRHSSTIPILMAKQYKRLNTLFDVAIVDSILVMVVFWGILYSPTLSFSWLAPFEHGVNTLLLLMEFVLNPFLIQRSSIVYASFLWPGAFAVFAWIAHDWWMHKWVYPFLNISKPSSPAWYAGMIIGHCVFFALCIGLSKVKNHFKPPTVLATTSPSSVAAFDKI